MNYKPYSSLVKKDSGMHWYGRILLWLAAAVSIICLFTLATIGAMFLMANAAHAKQPAMVIEDGKPSSKKVECDAKRRFTEIILNLRDKGHSQDEVVGMILARVIAAGMPPELACQMRPAIAEVWELKGSEKEMGQRVYYQCLDGEGA